MSDRIGKLNKMARVILAKMADVSIERVLDIEALTSTERFRSIMPSLNRNILLSGRESTHFREEKIPFGSAEDLTRACLCYFGQHQINLSLI